MSDTLLAGINPAPLISGDTLQAKVLLYSKDAAESDSLLTIWMPLIGVLLGAATTLAAQLLMKRYESKLLLKKEILNCKNALRANIDLLRFLLKDLAYLKCDTSLQEHYSNHDPTEEEKKQARDEIYNNYKYISEKEAHIYKIYIEMSNQFDNYYTLSQLRRPPELATAMGSLRNKLIDLEKAPAFPGPDPQVHRKCSVEIKNLTTVYHSHLTDIDSRISSIL